MVDFSQTTAPEVVFENSEAVAAHFVCGAPKWQTSRMETTRMVSRQQAAAQAGGPTSKKIIKLKDGEECSSDCILVSYGRAPALLCS